MNKRKITGREITMIVIMVLIIVTTVYYLFFYFPHNANMYNTRNEINLVDTDISKALIMTKKKKDMQKELEEILKQPQDQITEIARYDNKKQVLNMLYGILSKTKDYSLSFQDPEVEENGTVRRHINMGFTADNYEGAKEVLKELAASKWRCIISNLSINGDPDMMQDVVTVSVDITFFEKAEIKQTEPTETTEVPLEPAA